MKVLDHLLKAVRDTAVFNPGVPVAPACILWPNRDRQWEAVIPVKWNDNRGKDVESVPWHHIFKGDRIYDFHLTLVEKREAREAAE